MTVKMISGQQLFNVLRRVKTHLKQKVWSFLFGILTELCQISGAETTETTSKRFLNDKSGSPVLVLCIPGEPNKKLPAKEARN